MTEKEDSEVSVTTEDANLGLDPAVRRILQHVSNLRTTRMVTEELAESDDVREAHLPSMANIVAMATRPYVSLTDLSNRWTGQKKLRADLYVVTDMQEMIQRINEALQAAYARGLSHNQNREK